MYDKLTERLINYIWGYFLKKSIFFIIFLFFFIITNNSDAQKMENNQIISSKNTNITDFKLPEQNNFNTNLLYLRDKNNIPFIIKSPSAVIYAYLGQTLILNAKVKNPKINEKTMYAWVLNGSLICNTLTCKIPLNNKIINVGLSSLIFLSYNTYGSTMTKHTLKIIKGHWSPTQSFSDKYEKKEEAKNVNININDNQKTKTYSQHIAGNALQAYPENLLMIGSVSRNIEWNGYIKSNSTGIIRFNDLTNNFYMYQNTDINLIQNNEFKIVQILKGSARAYKKNTNKENNTQNNIIWLETNELSVLVDEGSDVYIERENPSQKEILERKKNNEPINQNMIKTHVITLSGTAKIKLKKTELNSQLLELPTGVELIVKADGTIEPYEKPKSEKMQNVMKNSYTIEDIIEQEEIKKKNKDKIKTSEQIDKAKELAEREDYFEILNELKLIEDRIHENSQIPYFMGLAYKGLYQEKEAEKYFKLAILQDKYYADPSWELGLMYMEDKKWQEALNNLQDAKSKLNSKDKRYAEYEYFSGVANYNLNNNFSAKNNFFKAAMWNEQLEQVQKISAGEFLKKLNQKKPWSIISLIGVQLDNNALSLEQGAEIPANFKQNNLYRFIAGLISNYDTSIMTDETGLFLGGGISAMAIKHSPNYFNNFNMYILGANFFEIYRFKMKKELNENEISQNQPENTEIKNLKITESLSIPIINNEISQISFNIATNYEIYNLSLNLDYDINSQAELKRHALSFKEGVTNLLGNFLYGILTLDTALNQKLAISKNINNGNNLGLDTNLSHSFSYSSRLIFKTSVPFSIDKSFFGTENLNFKIGFSLTTTTFIEPWLILLFTPSIDYTKTISSFETTKNIIKPQIMLMLTGIF